MGQVFQKFQHRSRHLVFEIAAVFSYSKNEFTRNMCLGEKMAFLELCSFVLLCFEISVCLFFGTKGHV